MKKKEVPLSSGVNLIYGENESGKSTLLNFMVSSFYGISKNKKGKVISDYEQYKPWNTEEFSGKIQYELDSGEKLEVFRDFYKKNPVIFNEKGEDVSKRFSIDKTKGNQFFYEQTQMDEDLFLSTLAINQQEVKLEKQEQSVLIQKIANLIGTGEDNVSYQRAIDRLNRKQLEEIGTERSREKPINIVQKKIEQLVQEKNELLEDMENYEKVQEERQKLQEELISLETEITLLKKWKEVQEEKKLQLEKLKVKEEFQEQNRKRIDQLQNKIQQQEVNNNNIMKTIKEKNRKNTHQKKRMNTILIIMILLFFIISLGLYIVLEAKLLAGVFIIIPLLGLIGNLVYQLRNGKKKKQKEDDLQKTQEIQQQQRDFMQQEKQQLEEQNKKIEEEIFQMKNQIYFNERLEQDKMRQEYKAIISEEQFDIIVHLEDLTMEREAREKEYQNLLLQKQTNELEEERRYKKQEKMAEIEEKLAMNQEIKMELQQKNESISLAKEILTSAYEKMRNSVTPKFTEKLSYTISKITHGKYTKVNLDETTGLNIELEDGNYVSVDRLSVGTIDQLYLSLRLAMMDELSQEKIPLILDEAFAFYDTDRLTNILRYLAKEIGDRQVLIFTCTNREKEILEKLQVKYHYIDLQEIS